MSMAQQSFPRRKYPEEGTRDPIFLLQVKRHTLFGLPDWLATDGDCFWVEDKDHWEVPEWMLEKEKSEDGLDDDAVETFLETYDLTGSGSCYLDSWDTERVFFTRQEAQDWAAARAYRWPDGYRVYCVPVEGELADVLRSHTDYEQP